MDNLVDLPVKCTFHGESNTGSIDFSVEGFPDYPLDEDDSIQLAREAISLLNTHIEMQEGGSNA